jgi:hypothetical protein
MNKYFWITDTGSKGTIDAKNVLAAANQVASHRLEWVETIFPPITIYGNRVWKVEIIGPSMHTILLSDKPLNNETVKHMMV